MKRKTIYLASLLFLMLGAFTNSCMEENETPITEPARYTSNDVKSYADLFKVFWNVMDQRYNYFYEQKQKGGMDWNTVYKEYYPKFAALKSYHNAGATDAEIQADAKKAQQYFTDIIDPIIDRHFFVDITVPYSNSGTSNTLSFWGGMKTKRANIYEFGSKYTYMKDKLQDDALTATDFLLAGNLKSNPDIYYFSFAEFELTNRYKINLENKYLSPDPGNDLVLTQAAIENSQELNTITNSKKRNDVKNLTINILNKFNLFTNSNEMKSFHNQMNEFKNTEILTDSFLALATQLLTESQGLNEYNNPKTYSKVMDDETLPYIKWFVNKMGNHVKYGYQLQQFQKAAKDIIGSASFYKKFLNPLHKGDIKKIIIDLRGNGGGLVADARFFTDRFITKSTTAYYQRTREGNGQFNYTPWVPTQVYPHKFGIPNNIPIVILTDKGSVSMSEMSTMMLKSQGAHVVSIGDYSYGGTAGIGGPDEFNGGIPKTQIAGIFTFYIPLMAFKDANGQVIEGIGVKPDIYVTPPSDAEVAQMKSSPKTFVDRVMQEAIKYLSSK